MKQLVLAEMFRSGASAEIKLHFDEQRFQT